MPTTLYRAERALKLGRALAALRHARPTRVQQPLPVRPPAHFQDGDQIKTGGVIYTRRGGKWVDLVHPRGLTTDDQAMRDYWTPRYVARFGDPVYTPAAG